MPTIDSMVAQSLHEHGDGYSTTDAGGTIWARVTVQDDGDSRWHHDRTLVLCDDNGDLWGVSYRVGLTEEQEHEYPWEHVEDVPLTRMYAQTATTTVYRSDSAEANG